MESRPGIGLQANAVDVLGGRIARGELPVGTVINPEAIGDELGVSRTVVRESLRTLEALGMIHARPRAGTRVRPTASWNLLDARVIAWRSEGPAAAHQVQELIALREAIEPTAAESAAAHMAPGVLDDLRELVQRMDIAYAAVDSHGFARADGEFHATILRASGNAVIQQLLTTIEAALRSRYAEFPAFSSASTTALVRHRELVESFAAGDSAAAGVIMRTLIRESRDELWRPTG